MTEELQGLGRFFARPPPPRNADTNVRRCLPAEGLASLGDASVDVVLTTPHGAGLPALASLLDLAATKTRRLMICAWQPRNVPPPPVGWHEVAVHVWDKRDPRAEHPFELITVWSKDPEPMPCLLFSASAPEASRTWDVHPSSKPASVLRQLLFTYSRPDDVILDPFHGTGSVARACERLKRPYIGFVPPHGSRQDEIVASEERIGDDR